MRTIATNNLNDIYAKDGNLFLAEGKDAIGNVLTPYALRQENCRLIQIKEYHI